MVKIPIHRISEKYQGEFVFLKYISDDTRTLSDSPVDYAHRDDYYIFLFTEKGKGKLLIDFEEFELTENFIRCILPGQVHFSTGLMNGNGWILGVNPILVKDEYKEIFNKVSLVESEVCFSESVINELKHCISILQQRLHPDRIHIEESIMHDLLSYYIGIIAEAYHKGLPVSVNNRYAEITFQFKSLLSDNYKVIKSPSQYASKLNLSSVYLNEAVKKTTGLTVTECIQNEIITQAQRLLFYTNLSVKEIALELGYEDWTYFTRLFTKVTLLSPTQFRKKFSI